MSTTYVADKALTTVVQYDISMALYALEKALSRLPPEHVVSEPFVSAIESLFGTLHQDFRTAIFTIEQIRDRIALEGIADHDSRSQQQFAAQEAIPSLDVSWVLPLEVAALQTLAGKPPWTHAKPEGETLETSLPLPDVQAFEGLGTGQSQAVRSQQHTDPYEHLQPVFPDEQYGIMPPAEADYAKLPSPDRHVARRLWMQLEPFKYNDSLKDLWWTATDKLAELRTQGHGRGTWSDHVVRETATWRCLKVWQAVRNNILEQTTTDSSTGQEQLDTVDKALAMLGHSQ